MRRKKNRHVGDVIVNPNGDTAMTLRLVEFGEDARGEWVRVRWEEGMQETQCHAGDSIDLILYGSHAP